MFCSVESQIVRNEGKRGVAIVTLHAQTRNFVCTLSYLNHFFRVLFFCDDNVKQLPSICVVSVLICDYSSKDTCVM